MDFSFASMRNLDSLDTVFGRDEQEAVLQRDNAGALLSLSFDETQPKSYLNWLEHAFTTTWAPRGRCRLVSHLFWQTVVHLFELQRFLDESSLFLFPPGFWRINSVCALSKFCESHRLGYRFFTVHVCVPTRTADRFQNTPTEKPCAGILSSTFKSTNQNIVVGCIVFQYKRSVHIWNLLVVWCS